LNVRLKWQLKADVHIEVNIVSYQPKANIYNIVLIVIGAYP